MVTTMTQAAKQLGIAKQQLYRFVKSDVVSGQRAGRVVLIDPEQARRELEADGYYERSEQVRRSRLKNKKVKNCSAE